MPNRTLSLDSVVRSAEGSPKLCDAVLNSALSLDSVARSVESPPKLGKAVLDSTLSLSPPAAWFAPSPEMLVSPMCCLTMWLSEIWMIPVDVWQIRSSYPSWLTSNTCKFPPIQGQNTSSSVSNSSPKNPLCSLWSETKINQELQCRKHFFGLMQRIIWFD